MLMNAGPRSVSYGFDTFVPFPRRESLHQRLVEMTNNDMSAWSFYRPGHTPAGGWDQSFDEYNENYPDLYSGYYQDQTSVPHRPSTTALTPLHASGYQVQGHTQKSASISQSMHHGQATASTCMEIQRSMVSVGHSQRNHSARDGSFANFSDTKNALFTYKTFDEADVAPYTSANSMAPHQAFQETMSAMTDISVDTISPSITYGRFPGYVPVVPTALVAPCHQDTTMEEAWGPKSSGNSHHQDIYGLEMLHDGLTEPKQQHHGYPNPWNATSDPSAQWTAQQSAATTAPIPIFSKALALEVPAPAFSTSPSSGGYAPSSGSAASSFTEESLDTSTEYFTVVKSSPIQKHKQMPRDGMSQARMAPVTTSDNFRSTKTSRKRPPKARSERRRRLPSSSPYDPESPVASVSSYKVDSVSTETAPEHNEPRQESESESSQESITDQATHCRNAQDIFLVRSRLDGMSYKDIQREGGFSEAESTLRGRYRTLTKQKADRVRKPEWTDNDIKLLKKAYWKLENGARVSWKRIAEYIANNGGSYHFGNATCRKKWDDLQAKGRSWP